MNDMERAIKKLDMKMSELMCKNPKTGEYNFYVEHFMNEETKDLADALDSLGEDQTGYFSEFMDEMREEIEEFVRSMWLSKVYVTFFEHYYLPMRPFRTREEYVTDEIAQAKKARAEYYQHFKKLGNYYDKGVKNHDDTISTDC